LAGLVDEEGGARIEDAAGGDFRLPWSRRGGRARWRCAIRRSPWTMSVVWFQRGEDWRGGEELAEDAVGEGEIVEVGAATLLVKPFWPRLQVLGLCGMARWRKTKVGLIGGGEAGGRACSRSDSVWRRRRMSKAQRSRSARAGR